MMNRMFRNVALALMFALVGLAGVQANEGHEEMTVQGEILDMACYVGHEAKGPDHAKCAEKCVKGGQPMGLLAEDGTVYLLYASHKDPAGFEKAKEFAGKKVEITGKHSKQGSLSGIEVLSVKPI